MTEAPIIIENDTGYYEIHCMDSDGNYCRLLVDKEWEACTGTEEECYSAMTAITRDRYRNQGGKL